MKRLIMVNGTMGVGKTATCKELFNLLQPSVFLDGDWCWNMKPFIVTDETKQMVTDNIIHLLKNFLLCSEYENVIFCWVMQYQCIMDSIIRQMPDMEYELYQFTLTISKQALKQRILKDVECHTRTADVFERSVRRLPLYKEMNTIKINVSDITPRQAAESILHTVFGTEEAF